MLVCRLRRLLGLVGRDEASELSAALEQVRLAIDALRARIEAIEREVHGHREVRVHRGPPPPA